MAFLTTTVGSFPEPRALEEARARFETGEIDASSLRTVEDDAVREAIRAQEARGVSLLVDGEMDRPDPVAGFVERLGGVEIAGVVRVFEDRYARKPKIAGPVTRAGATTVERWRFASALARGPVKAAIPGPYTLMDGSFDEHYGSRRAACKAFAEIVRAEVADLVAAGATEIQIDEPAAGARPGEISLLADSLARAAGPAAGRARLWVYLGYPDLERDGAALAAIPADGLLVAAAHADLAGLGTFAAALPTGRFVGVGVVDTLASEVEPPNVVAGRLARAAASIPADRIWAIPDGGFRGLAPDLALAKLAALVAGARA